LGGIEDLSEVAEGALLVEDFVGFRKLLAIVTWGATCLIDFTKSLHLVQEPLASSLAVLGVKVVFLVRSLLEVIAHHHGVFEEQEIRGSPVLLYFG